MAQAAAKVYVEWPDYNENSYRFVSSRLGNESDPEVTFRAPAREENDGRVNKKKPGRNKADVTNPSKAQQNSNSNNRGAPQQLNPPMPDNSNEADSKDLQREAAYQADLQRRLEQFQQKPARGRNGQKSPIPPLNFTDMDRSSMQEFIREEIDLNLRSSDEDDQARKGAGQNNHGTRPAEEFDEDVGGSPRGEIVWGNKHKPPKKHETGQYPDFVEDNKNVKREKPKKSYVKMLKTKRDYQDGSSSSSAPARTNDYGGGKHAGGVEREAANFSQLPAGPPPQFVMPPPLPGVGFSSTQSMLPPLASTLSAYYQQQVPSSMPPFQTPPSNYAPFSNGMAMPYASLPAFGSQPNVSGPLMNDETLQNRMGESLTHLSQPDLSGFETDTESLLHQKASLLSKVKGRYAAASRMRTVSEAPTTHSTLPPGDLYTVVTLQRNAAALPPIDDRLARTKHNADIGIPASVSPGYDAGYMEMYSKQRKGADYKKYTLDDYRALQRVEKLDQKLGPDLTTAEYKNSLDKRKRQQMYGRRVNEENARILAEEREVLMRAKEQGARYVTYDDPEEMRERKRLEVVDIGDPQYNPASQKITTQRTARSDHTIGKINFLGGKSDLKRVDLHPASPGFGRTKALPDAPGDVLNVRTVPPPIGSTAKHYQDNLIDTHRKLDTSRDKAAIAIPPNMSEKQFLRSFNIADTSKQLTQPQSNEEPQKPSKREVAKKYAERVRRQHMKNVPKKQDANADHDLPRSARSNQHKFKYGTYSFEFEQLDDELARLHNRHMVDKVRAESIRQAY